MSNLEIMSIYDKYNVINCYTTRKGGISKGIYDSLNMGFSRGDDKKNVIKNYEIVCDELGIDINSLVLSYQTHTTNIRVVDKKDCGKGINKTKDYIDVDGLITNKKGIGLVTFYADCVPLYFYDTVNEAIGLSHAGWKGTVNNMVESTINEMKNNYGTKASNLICAIGPSICGECFEVGKEVYDEFKLKFPNDIKKILVKQINEKYYLDLKLQNKLIMMNCGIKEENIEVSKECTKCKKDKYFSHRNMGNERGSQVAIMQMK